MQKIISFSLWGDSPKYTVGILRNIELAYTLYPGWTARVYADETIPAQTYASIMDFGAEVVVKPASVGFRGLFWRFLPAMDETVERMISRDADSRLSQRERDAVRAWEESGTDFHMMRDHRAHSVPILGGMWGCRPVAVSARFAACYRSWVETMESGTHRRGPYFDQDQRFLRHAIWPWAQESCLAHDDAGRYGGIPFLAPRPDDHFVGEVYDA